MLSFEVLTCVSKFQDVSVVFVVLTELFEVVSTRFYGVVLEKCFNLENKIVLGCFNWFWIVSCRFRVLQSVVVCFVFSGCVTLFGCIMFFFRFCKLCFGLFRSFFLVVVDCVRMPRLSLVVLAVLGCHGMCWLFWLFGFAFGCSCIVHAVFELF